MSGPVGAMPSETFSIMGPEDDVSKLKDMDLERRTINKLNWHLMTLCGGIILIAFMDRGNVGYAASEMCRDLHLTHSEYGIGTSIFYTGYILSQLGSNVMLKRFGAPIWLPFILFCWGCAAALMSLVQSSEHLYILRVLLGIAEGGTFPGVWYYLTLFYPDKHLGEPVAVTIAAIGLAMPVSAPLAAGLLSLDGLFGIAGWRILFLVEGLIPILYSMLLLGCLPSSIEHAKFLNQEEKRLLQLERDKKELYAVERNIRDEMTETIKSKKFWLLTVGCGTFNGCLMILMYWMTLIVQDMLHGSEDGREAGTCASDGGSVVAVVLTAIPDSLAGVLCLLAGRYQSSVKNRTFLSGAICVFSAASLMSWVLTRKISFVCGFLSLTAAVMLTKIPTSFIVSVITTLFDQSMRSTVVAMFNSISNTGSFVLPLVMGLVLDSSGYATAILLTGAAIGLSACCMFAVRDPRLTTT